jgi:kumamolisin
MTAHVLAGSLREPLAGARPAEKANPKERLEVTVLVRRQNAGAFAAKVAKLAAGDRSEAWISHADFARQFGASPVDMAAVKEFARRHDLAVVQEDAARRTVVLSGTVARFDRCIRGGPSPVRVSRRLVPRPDRRDLRARRPRRDR